MSAKQSFGLGKGLEALLEENDVAPESVAPAKGAAGGAEASAQGAGRELLVELSKLKPNPFQPRTEFAEGALDELAESIREHGVIQPVLAEDAGDGTFYIIAGERRTRAAERAGLKQIPVILKKFSDENKLEVALIENIQREDLNPVEEARAYQRIMQLSGISQDEAAKRVGKNRSTVANALRLLKLPEDMQSALAAGSISAGHARALLSVANSADQRILFAHMMGTGMSVREAEQHAAELNGGAKAAAKKPSKAAPAKDPDTVALEQQFIEALGTKVSLKGGLERGTLQIEYFSRADLDRIYGILVKTE